MRRLYPRSFPRLLAVGFALVALPLVFALVNNAVSVDRLANRSQNAVVQAVHITQASRRLAQLLGALERTARQIMILEDRSLLDTYAANRLHFQQTIPNRRNGIVGRCQQRLSYLLCVRERLVNHQ